MSRSYQDFQKLWKRLDRIDSKLDLILTKENTIMAREQELLDAITAETDAGTAMGMLLDKIAADLAALKSGMDPAAQAKIDQAITNINVNKDTWIAKTLQDTPAEPPA